MRKRLLLIGLVLLVAIPLALVLRGFVRQVIVVQLLRLLWAGQVFFDIIPQLPLWVFFLVMVVLIAARSLTRRRKPVQDATGAEVDRRGQVQVLTEWIERTTQGEYFRWVLAQYLGELVLEALAHHGRATPEQIRWRLKTGRLDVPPEIEAYLQAGQAPMLSRPANLFSRLGPRSPSRAHSSPLDLDPERIVRFLEDQLEVQHDGRNR